MSLPTSCTARCHMHNVMNNLPLSTRLSRWSQHFSPRRPIAAAMSSLLHPAYPNTKPPVPPLGTEPLAAVTPDYQHAVLAASPLLPTPLPTHKPLLTLSTINTPSLQVVSVANALKGPDGKPLVRAVKASSQQPPGAQPAGIIVATPAALLNATEAGGFWTSRGLLAGCAEPCALLAPLLGL